MVNGVSLPNGATLEIPAIFLHRDPEHWPDPEKFDPERSDQLFKNIYIYPVCYFWAILFKCSYLCLLIYMYIYRKTALDNNSVVVSHLQPSQLSICESRFTPEAKAARHPFVYLPFGAGPRNCVGMRVAQLEMKMGLARLFHAFSLVTCAETEVGWDYEKGNICFPTVFH